MENNRRFRLAIVTTHPVQYYVPWYRALASHPEVDLTVFYCFRQSEEGQAQAGFGVAFAWDIPLLEGYTHHFLENVAPEPNVFVYSGCDTPEIADRLRAGRFDAVLVQGWYVKSYWQTMRACWKQRIPLMVRGDSQLANDRSRLKRWVKYGFYRWFLGRFDALLPVGQRSREYYEYYGVRPEVMHFAPHAVDNDFFFRQLEVYGPQRETVRARWGIAPEARVVLFVGKFIPIKRPQDLLAAAGLAQEEIPQLHILLVGDGPLRGELEELAARHQLKVTFAGFLNQSQITGAYAAADGLVLCSESETWGLVVNEAMACGLPVVVGDRVGCAPDLVQAGKTGEVFPTGDVPALARALVRIVAGPPPAAGWRAETQARIQTYTVAEAVRGTVAALRRITQSL